MRKQYILTLLITVVCFSCVAVDKFYWNNTTTSSDAGDIYLWNTESNWSDTNNEATDLGLPTSSDFAKHVKSAIDIQVTDAHVIDKLVVTHNDVPSITIKPGGSLTVNQNINLGTFGTGGGLISVDGGDFITSATISMSPTASGTSTIEVKSGNFTSTGQFWVGNQGAGTSAADNFNISGGTSDLAKVIVGRQSSGVLNMTGGSLVITNTTWDALQIAHQGTGSGTVNISGGNLKTYRIDIDKGGGGGTLNILGGTVEVPLGWNSAIEIDNAGTINFAGGQLNWINDKTTQITNFVNSGIITWTSGMTNMLTESWDHSYTNGESVLFVDYNDARSGYTTVWAYDTTPPVTPEPPTGPTAYTNDTDGATISTFNNDSGDGLYTTASNWDVGTVPTLIDSVVHDSAGVLTVPTDTIVEALDLDIAANDTASISVVKGGSLGVSNNIVLGNGGGFSATPGIGKLIVDGGNLSVGGDIKVGQWGAPSGRQGILELNSGIINVSGVTDVGGGSDLSSGSVTMVGGVFSNAANFRIGYSPNGGDGVVNITQASLIVDSDADVNEDFNPLKLGGGIGDATLNIYDGGFVSTTGIDLNKNSTEGTASINLYGGTLQLTKGWSGHVDASENSEIHIAGGQFDWRWNRSADMQSMIDAGTLTWSGGSTNMISDTWDSTVDFAVTNQAGTSVLYIEEYLVPGYTTAWAFDLSSLPVEPEGFDAFASTYNLSGGMSGDDDGDQMSNFAEYALNGNPTNASVTGSAFHSHEGDTFKVIHSKLANDDSAVYRLIDTTDLRFGTHATNAYLSQSQSDIDGDYVTVTNIYDMSGKSTHFIEIETEQQ
tara:strand:+ start:869 stop:3361 length:2493 start_codon:yes stop_codon:yes gene_type:complete